MKHLYLKTRGRVAALLFFSGMALCQAAPSVAGPTDAPDPELRRLLSEAVASADSFEDRFDAEVWLLDMSQRLERFSKDPAERLSILRMVHAEASRANLAPELVLAVIEVESAFNKYAVSVAGAQGLMQIMPFWLKEIGRPDDSLMQMRTNLRMGCTILRYYIDKERGNLVGALARYNGSYGKPEYPHLVIKALGNRWYRT